MISKIMDKCGTDEGLLVIFDRNQGRSWDEKIFRREEIVRGKKIHVWGDVTLSIANNRRTFYALF